MIGPSEKADLRHWQTSDGDQTRPMARSLMWFWPASSLICGIKFQLDATEVSIADLIACSTCFGHHYAHHQELKSSGAQWLPVVFGAAVFKLLDAALSSILQTGHNPQPHTRPTTWKPQHQIPQATTTV